ncbi:ABC transporter permease [Starkeya sp. ORNL1]|uniref:ABC transporter permease n=1 Tax=Starkeya sp. ORNL1 TaxID=2709380 RepID=UPI0014630826|nr:ABC transporter permease [Starkeya sp. ORNL1]QJP14351.1 ABC transporter permease [Starkeya sp. ORNL1]
MSDLGIERATPLTAALALGDDRRLLSDAGRLLAPLWRRASTLLIALLLPAALVAVWSLAVRWEVLAPQILPAPGLVWQTLVDLVVSGQLFSELAVSLGRVAAGVVAGGLLGLGFGIAFGVSPRFEAYVSPTVRAIFLVPSLGWLPFFMLIFGIGETLKIVLIAKTCFLPPMVNAFDAIRALPDKYRDVARVLELDHRATLRYVVLPAVLPAVATGFRLALSKGWKALILVEMISSAAGIGYLMMWGRKSFQLDVVFATMVVIGLVGWALDHGLFKLQQRATGWSFHSAE